VNTFPQRRCFAELGCQQGTNEAWQSMSCPEIQWLNQNGRTGSTTEENATTYVLLNLISLGHFKK